MNVGRLERLWRRRNIEHGDAARGLVGAKLVRHTDRVFACVAAHTRANVDFRAMFGRRDLEMIVAGQRGAFARPCCLWRRLAFVCNREQHRLACAHSHVGEAGKIQLGRHCNNTKNLACYCEWLRS